MIFSVVVLVVDCCQDDLVEYALFCKKRIVRTHVDSRGQSV